MIAEIINPATLGFILVAVMLFAIFVGFPISFTLIFLGFFFGYLGFGPLVFYLMTLQFSMVMTAQALAAVPLFVFMGIMMEQAGLMERLFSSVQLMLARVRGSLYYAVLFVSVIFAAATGIVDTSLYILFYFPGLLFFFYMTTGFVQESIMRGERGMDTAWMPYMWPIKACLWFGILFLLIQGISEVLKSYYAATKGRWPDQK